MRQYKRILAAIGTAVLLVSNLGMAPQTVFAGEQITASVQSESADGESDIEVQAGAAIMNEAGGTDGTGSQSNSIESNQAGTQNGAAGTAESDDAGSLETAGQSGQNDASVGDEADQESGQSGAEGATSGTDTGDHSGDANQNGTSNANNADANGANGTNDAGATNTASGTINTNTDASSVNSITIDDTQFQILVDTDADDGIAMADISGSTTVPAGSTISLSCSNWWCNSGTWSSSDTDIATVTGSGRSATVTGVKTGTVTISHQHRNNNWETDSINITVTRERNYNAAVYTLKDPDGKPGLNEFSGWTGILGVAEINTTGAKWVQSGDYANAYNVTENVADYIVSWPDGQTGGTWTVDKENTYFNTIWSAIQSTYEGKLQDQLSITEDITDYITDITLTPYKISRGNGTSSTSPYDRHVDCTISIHLKRYYTAQFNVKEVDADDYSPVHTVENTYQMELENYRPSADPVQPYTYVDSTGDTYEIGATKVVNGTTYKLTGWYTENDDGEARSDETADFSGDGYELKKVTELDDDGNEVVKDLPELKGDYVVNFYAEWVPVTGDLKVTKVVSSNIGAIDPDGKYSITIHLEGVSNKDYGEYHFDEYGDCTVILGNNESVTIEGIDSGTVYTVTEAATSGDGYQVSYEHQYYKQDENGNQVSVEDATDGQIYPEGVADVTVNNARDVVLTGVDTGEIPWIAMMAAMTMAVISGAAYTQARRHYTR